MEMLNFRIEKTTKEKIKSLRDWKFPHLGISDVQRNLVMESLAKYQEPATSKPNILIISQKIEYDIPLDLPEIQFLFVGVHNAYRKSRKFSFESLDLLPLNVDYLLDCLDAFDAIISQAKKIPEEDIHYYLNLLKENRDKKEKDVKNLVKQIKERVKTVDQRPFSSNRGIGSKVIGALFDYISNKTFHNVPIKNLHTTLSPFYKSLATLTKRGLWNEGANDVNCLFHYPYFLAFRKTLLGEKGLNDDYQLPARKGTFFRLSFNPFNPMPIGLLSIYTHKKEVGSCEISGLRFFDCIKLFSQVKGKGSGRGRGRQNSSSGQLSLYGDGENYGFVCGPTRFYLSLQAVLEISKISKSILKEHSRYFEI